MRRIVLMTLLAFALGVMAEEPAYKTYKPAPFYYQRASLFEILPTDTTDIIMLGNSITNGCEWHELFRRPEIKNRGISSDGIDGVSARIDPVVAGRPAKIFLMIGVNDIARGMPVDTIAAKILDLADHIAAESPRTALYVQSVLPYNASFGRYQGLFGKESWITALNDHLNRNAAEHGYVYIDLFSSFADDEGRLDTRYTNDGLHLTGDGYMLWRSILEPYLD